MVSGKAWDEFCDTLKAAGAALTFPGAPRDPFDQAEGYRYLSRLARGGLMAFVEHADPRAPVLHRVAHETVKLGSDNPDNYYQTAAIHGDFEYRISGRRNTVTYLGFGTQAGHYGQSGGLPPTGYIEAGEMEIDEDGTFELIVSGRRHGGNWLPMTAESRTLIVRQTFLDRETEAPAELRIERIGCAEDEKRPRPLTPEQLDEGLKSAGTLVAGASMLFANWARGFRKHSNTLPMFDPEVSLQAGGDPNIAYYHSHWAVADDEALLIEAMPPECEHWNFQLNNYWMESLDYRHHTIHTNKHLAHHEEDGSVRLVVCHEDPGLPNWLETAGHTSGTMCFRWIRAAEHPQPRTRLVKLSELRALREA
ncbi:MAG: hypothetical protein F4Z72_11180 [Gemmatimonadales bacterium]|nr:hypothetical protein [Candidatus Palauibacter irciniicola]MYC18808.1 hypothetical protein [Gemmatimonadales bacterium]